MKVYIIETPKEVFWSYKKMDTTYKHVEYLYRDKAKYRELEGARWKKFKSQTKKSIYEIVT